MILQKFDRFIFCNGFNRTTLGGPVSCAGSDVGGDGFLQMLNDVVVSVCRNVRISRSLSPFAVILGCFALFIRFMCIPHGEDTRALAMER